MYGLLWYPIIKDDGRKLRDLDIETADYVQTGILVSNRVWDKKSN